MVAILKWMFVLVLLLAVAVGGTAYWLVSRGDAELRQLVLSQLKTLAPNLKFDISRAHGELNGRVWLYGMTIRLPGDDPEKPSIEIPETIVTLDSQPMMDLENIVIQKLRIVKPKVRATRLVNGEWNLQKIKFPSAVAAVLPDVEIEHGSILVEVQLPSKSARRLVFKNFNVSAIPKDARKLAIQVGAILEPSGPLTMEIDLNLDGPTWECVTPETWRVPVDSKLIQLLCDLSPQIEDHVATAERLMKEAKTFQAVSGRTGLPGSTTANLRSRTQSDSALPDFGLKCDCGLKFRANQTGPGSPLMFSAIVSIENGKIENDLLPFPLHELRGKILVDNDRKIIVRELRATNGPVQIEFSGDVVPSKPIEARLKLRGIEIDDEFKARLPEKLRNKVQDLGLTGICDVDAAVIQDGSGWRKEVDLQLSRGTITDKRFPVTVRNVVGELRLRQNVVTFSAKGQYAKRPVTASGTIKNPGPDYEAELLLTGDDLPLDDESIAACPPAVGKTIESLRLRCRHDLRLNLRTTGPGKKLEPDLTDAIRDGSMSFKGFPYDIRQLRGIVKWNGELVEFKELEGFHDGAKLSARGTFQRGPSPGRLDLFIDANDAAFEESLRLALPPTLREVWNDFQPKGIFDIRTQIAWIPGEPCEVRIPRVKVRDGTVLMACFPWPLQDLKGEFAFNTDPDTEPAKLTIKEVYARHDDTQLRATGVGWFRTNEPWRLKFDQLNVDDLIPNATFRNALPQGLQRVFDTMRPEGVFSFYGPVEFFGPPGRGQSLSALWNLKSVLLGCNINAGTRVDDINGEVQLSGQWDGTEARLNGELKLDSVSVFRQKSGQMYQITSVNGPFRLRDGKFVAGTELALPQRRGELDRTKRIRGEAIDGTVYLDAAVDLRGELDYQVFLELEKGRLENFAKRYLQGQSNLAGVMNGRMSLHGQGSNSERMTGQGALRIAPAALYELPLFVQMFRMPQLRASDRTAFEQAEVKFTEGESRFDFNSIELLGETMSLVGRGYIRFDGAMNLDFGSRPGRGRRRLIPFMGAEWVAVRVTGNVGDPKTTIVPVPQLDDAMRQLLGTFNPQPQPLPNAKFVPRTGQTGIDAIPQ